jgi:hypothetical protein
VEFLKRYQTRVICADSKTRHSKGSVKHEVESKSSACMVWTVLPCHPQSPDLAPSDFDLFSPLKDALQGWHFADQLQHSVHEELPTFQPTVLHDQHIAYHTKVVKACSWGTLWKCNNFEKDVPTTYVNFITTVIIVYEKKKIKRHYFRSTLHTLLEKNCLVLQTSECRCFPYHFIPTSNHHIPAIT